MVAVAVVGLFNWVQQFNFFGRQYSMLGRGRATTRGVIHDGPIFEIGYYTIRDRPGYGIEINPEVAKAHLAPGETWWG
jgi:L-alanine-DL-glutamate epimerase-like enolase superfamily enzyme